MKGTYFNLENTMQKNTRSENIGIGENTLNRNVLCRKNIQNWDSKGKYASRK